jgi:hypothetical protein
MPVEISLFVGIAIFTWKEFPMHRVNNYSISKESLEDMIGSGRFNPSLEITFQDKPGRHKLGAGYGDDVEVYREGTETFILYTNDMLGYLGLEVFEGTEKQGDIFLEEYELKDVLGSENLAPFNVIKYLREYIT